MRTSIPAAGLGALLLAAGAVSCGADKSPEMTPAAAVAKAAKNTEDITSLHYRLSGTAPGEGRVKGEASMRLKPSVAMSMKMTAPDKGATEAVEIRLVDKAMYIGGADMAKQMDGKSWMKFDLSKTKAGKDLDQMGTTSQAEQNPAAESGFLAGAKDVKEVGSEKVDGVETTHYTGTVTLKDLRASLKDEKAAVREQREKSIKQYEKLGVDKLTMDMWVDGDDHTKQFRMKGDADKGPLDMTITFLDYNKPVNVEAPPAKDVADLADMFKGLDAS
ncbi:LppX_LprAFG lipoprotein [Streptomyces djakartensis]|uniref:Lipoprotein n=1 Tax=Streptomyces djakartensis TaxID=68193 RepID=A0ABQ2Z473_9ACTN|nr:LppX_LprAFG lipoprotein [Streptomyces djakartensis]GGY03852.1 putative lipoprotein [Streptomyces djakartensis]